jgi:acyl-CoA thioesterase-2
MTDGSARTRQITASAVSTAESTADAFQRLLTSALTMTEIAADVFAPGAGKASFDRVYGGQVAAQCLLSAGLTATAGTAPDSLHVCYLRLGSPLQAITYEVERTRDSRSFSTRRVNAVQDGRVIATALASFHVPSPGAEHHTAADVATDPSALPSRDEEIAARWGGSPPRNAGVPWPIDIRFIDRAPWRWASGASPPTSNRMWIRAGGPLPSDDPLLHACVLAYASDLTMPDTAIYPHGVDWESLIQGRGMLGASLEHVLWFHRPVRADEWLLHSQESTVAAGSRGFATGRFHDRTGMLVASAAHEVLLRSDSRGVEGRSSS